MKVWQSNRRQNPFPNCLTKKCGKIIKFVSITCDARWSTNMLIQFFSHESNLVFSHLHRERKKIVINRIETLFEEIIVEIEWLIFVASRSNLIYDKVLDPIRPNFVFYCRFLILAVRMEHLWWKKYFFYNDLAQWAKKFICHQRKKVW